MDMTQIIFRRGIKNDDSRGTVSQEVIYSDGSKQIVESNLNITEHLRKCDGRIMSITPYYKYCERIVKNTYGSGIIVM